MTQSQRAAAKKADVKFTYADHEYTVAPSEEWSIDTLEAAEEGRIIAAVKSILGQEQFAEFRKHHNTARELGELFEAVGEAVGTPN